MRWRVVERIVLVFFLASAIVVGSGCRTPRTPLPVLDPDAVAAEREHQREAFLLADEMHHARLQAVAFPLLREAVVLFPGKSRPAIGISLMEQAALQPPYRETATRLFGLEEGPQVRAVAPGSPAEVAGFQRGDCIVRIGSHPPSDPDPLIDRLRQSLCVDEALEVLVARDGAMRTLTVTPTPIARYETRLAYSQAINARATGDAIEINLAMLRFCENETELAFIYAHELAHNALRHHRDYVINYLLGTAVDIALLTLKVPSANVIGATALHRPASTYEVEADYVALYLLARTGHDLDNLRQFWRRMALLGPERRASRHALWSHPEPAHRQVLLEHAVTEIQERLAAGLPLEPPS